MRHCVRALEKFGFTVFSGENQCGTVSFVPDCGCEELAAFLGEQDVCVRAGLHCAPLAHRSAGTLKTGTVRVSFGHNASARQVGSLISALERYRNTRGKNHWEL